MEKQNEKHYKNHRFRNLIYFKFQETWIFTLESACLNQSYTRIPFLQKLRIGLVT